MLNIEKEKESLFGLGSRFRITPDEYDEFFRPFDKAKHFITESEFAGLVEYHENELLKVAGIEYEQ